MNIYKLPGQERAEAYAGAALSRSCVRWPALGRHITGEVNGDRHLQGTYPLRPLGYRVARTKATDILPWVEYPGDPAAGPLQKDFPTAGISSVPVWALRPQRHDLDRIRPAIAWAYGRQVLVGEIDASELDTMNDDDTYRFAMRIGRQALKVTAGLWIREKSELWARSDIDRGDIVPVTAIPPDVAAY